MTDDLQPCILPFVNFSTNPFGRSRPCGYSKHKSETKIERSTILGEFNNELFKSVRRDFLAGKWPSNCERCRYMEEKRPGHSKKHSEAPYYQDLNHLIKNTRPDGTVSHFPRHIDIRVGTICNLKCIHCGTGNSSKWLEDKELLEKYENTQVQSVDNRWIDLESPMWEEVFEHLAEIEKFNFIGGEPFASRPHNRLLARMAESEHAPRLILHYVTNGTLLTTELISRLKKFRQVTLNISMDASGDVLEFFRFPIQAEKFRQNVNMVERESQGVFDIGLQWTSSNVSLFYLPQTLDFIAENFKVAKLKFCNFVDYPTHMSPQNLPKPLKQQIALSLEPYRARFPEIDFYLSHMNQQDLWHEHGATFINYLNDLSRVRSIDWRVKLAAMAKDLGSL